MSVGSSAAVWLAWPALMDRLVSMSQMIATPMPMGPIAQDIALSCNALPKRPFARSNAPVRMLIIQTGVQNPIAIVVSAMLSVRVPMAVSVSMTPVLHVPQQRSFVMPSA